MIRWHRDVPSSINQKLKYGRIDSAFISSIYSKDYRCTDFGIVAKGAVYSVFIIPKESGEDKASATSNALAKVLELDGRVLIGDKALKYYLSGGKGIDLSMRWWERTNLPFVFARLCYNRKGKNIVKIVKGFNTTSWKIPHYILKKEAQSTRYIYLKI